MISFPQSSGVTTILHHRRNMEGEILKIRGQTEPFLTPHIVRLCRD